MYRIFVLDYLQNIQVGGTYSIYLKKIFIFNKQDPSSWLCIWHDFASRKQDCFLDAANICKTMCDHNSKIKM